MVFHVFRPANISQPHATIIVEQGSCRTIPSLSLLREPCTITVVLTHLFLK